MKTILLFAAAITATVIQSSGTATARDHKTEAGMFIEAGAPADPECNLPVVRRAALDFIPAPERLDIDRQAVPFILNADVSLAAPGMESEAAIFADYVRRLTGITFSETPTARKIIFEINPDAPSPQYYSIKADNKTVTLSGGSAEGTFTAAMMLVKGIGAGTADIIEIPDFELDGTPAYGYRGAHFDVSRHFFNFDEVKTFIDMLALHGMNRFHWHLSDDQGWRIEIGKYPCLQTISSQRDSTVIGRNSGKWKHEHVGGFFTRQQAREIVDYAAARHIQVIPEIDMPGHMRAALAAYPDLGCTGGPYSVWTEWGVAEDVLCPGNPATMRFITDVLNEIMDIFPSDVIHIGGDECPKIRWKECPRCQDLIKRLGIKADDRFSAEDILQGYVSRHAADVAASRGRRIMGWDEILESDIPSDAIVMSWRGEAGGREGAERGHDVVMTPNDCMYFDFYQTKDTDFEPFAIGGFTPVEKVYRYDPARVTEGMDPEKAKHILGVQANLWTEYIPTFSHVQYMELPRMAALSEVQWTPADKKDYASFRRRIPSMLAIYDHLGYNYARHIADPEVAYIPDHADRSLKVRLSGLDGYDIRYTDDGTDPTVTSAPYTGEITVKQPAFLKFASFHDGRRGRVLSDSIHVNKASFAKVTLLTSPEPAYRFDGALILTDGITGTYNYRTGRWLGFNSQPLDAVIDLGTPTDINSVGFNVCVFSCDGVVDARDAKVYVSDDGVTFREAMSWTNEPISQADEFTVKRHIIPMPHPLKARFVRLVANQVVLPEWHSLAGSKAFLFVDEISIE